MAAIEIRRRGAIAEIRLNRPGVLNAMGLSFPDDLGAAAAELGADESVRVVLVTGEGRSFSSGLDLDDMAADRIDAGWFARAELPFRALETMGKAVLAGVQGYCLGGGLQLTIACDARIAADDAVFGLPAAKEAFLPGLGTYRLPRLVGMGWARHLILSGEFIGAPEALRIGLVNRVVPRDDLESELEGWAKRYAEVPPASIAWSKTLCNEVFDLPFEAFAGRLNHAMSEVIKTDDHLRTRAEWREAKERR